MGTRTVYSCFIINCYIIFHTNNYNPAFALPFALLCLFLCPLLVYKVLRPCVYLYVSFSVASPEPGAMSASLKVLSKY